MKLSARENPILDFTLMSMLMASSGGDAHAAAEQAKRFAATAPAVTTILKSAVTAGSTLNPAWASSLVDFERLSSAFVQLMRPRSLLGRLGGFQRAPFLTRTLRTSAAGSAAWVGEGRPIPASALSFASVNLGITKVMSLAIVTAELTKFWGAANQAAVQSEMIRTVAFATDRAFIDPGQAAVADVSPASITHDAVTIQSTGATATAVTADLKALAQQLIDAGSDLTNAAWVMPPRTALTLSLLRDSGGTLAFPTVTAIGGTLLGLPVLTTSAVPIVASPGTTTITLVDAARILLADDDLATVDASTQSTLQILDDPQTGAQSQVSLWQHGCVGIRVARFVSWAAADAGACAVLAGVTY